MEPFAETQNPEQLLAALQHAGRAPELALIRACIEQRAELTPGLLALLEQEPDPDWPEEDPRWYGQIHAGLLLIGFQEREALPIFARMFRDEDDEELAGEWFVPELAQYGEHAIPLALELLEDESAPFFSRLSALTLLPILAERCPAERERIVEALRSQLPPLGADGTVAVPDVEEDDDMLSSVVLALADVHDEGSHAHVLALFDADLVDPMFMEQADYLRHFEATTPPPGSQEHFDLLAYYERAQAQAEEERAWEARMAEQSARLARERAEQEERERRRVADDSTPYVRPEPKVGRNEPCPCGSGRKYKHCHGKPG
jgi:hypothetical protein